MVFLVDLVEGMGMAAADIAGTTLVADMFRENIGFVMVSIQFSNSSLYLPVEKNIVLTCDILAIK